MSIPMSMLLLSLSLSLLLQQQQQLLCASCSLGTSEVCYPKQFEGSSIVCECNSTHCGTIGKIQLEPGHVSVYESSRDGSRFERSTVNFGARSDLSDVTVTLLDETIQEILGFGGAFTDSCGFNWKALPEDLQTRLLAAYYGDEGSEYSMGRIPMAGCDFSLRDYTYDDTPNDFELKHFALQDEDFDYQIPMISKSNELARIKVQYFASPWTPPAWMKDTNKTVGPSKMKGRPGDRYHKAYANYFVKFYEAYKQNGVDIWAFTIQNEPSLGFQPWPWQIMGMTPDVERDFIKLDLGPLLFNATEGKVKLIILDDSRWVLPWWPTVVYSDPEAAKYVAGVGLHWYYNAQTGIESVNATYHLNTSKFIISTEACEGFKDNSVIKGSWERGENYAEDIVSNLRNGVSAWIDWNLCLSMTGGPNWVDRYVDSAILVDVDKRAFYMQPTYYAVAHFSKLLPRASRRIADTVETTGKNLHSVTFLRPDGTKATIIVNREDGPCSVKILDHSRTVSVTVKQRSIASVLWN